MLLSNECSLLVTVIALPKLMILYAYSTPSSVVGTIPLERVRFIGMPLFAANGTPLEAPIDETAPWPENLQYFGEPSPEIDANWKRLIGTRYFSVSEDEAVRVWGERRHEYINYQKGGYTAGSVIPSLEPKIRRVD